MLGICQAALHWPLGALCTHLWTAAGSAGTWRALRPPLDLCRTKGILSWGHIRTGWVFVPLGESTTFTTCSRGQGRHGFSDLFWVTDYLCLVLLSILAYSLLLFSPVSDTDLIYCCYQKRNHSPCYWTHAAQESQPWEEENILSTHVSVGTRVPVSAWMFCIPCGYKTLWMQQSTLK